MKATRVNADMNLQEIIENTGSTTQEYLNKNGGKRSKPNHTIKNLIKQNNIQLSKVVNNQTTNKMSKKKNSWIRSILDSEDKRVRPGTAAASSGVSRLSKKYYEMTKETLKQKVHKKYFQNFSSSPKRSLVKKKRNRTEAKFCPYTTKDSNQMGNASALLERSSAEITETRDKT
ncbi:unnamed protein product [Moneuplotes crassus]|uniref:Uncharacterized protein n=1 Tax=Euplotes crassus TaxID=5936 RepID=A0AAD1Y809_EUPCR|nr:unnamed protein product [Moneuplotes crassus]